MLWGRGRSPEGGLVVRGEVSVMVDLWTGGCVAHGRMGGLATPGDDAQSSTVAPDS